MTERAQTSPNSGVSRVFIVEDHPVFRKGLSQLVNGQKDLTVCGEAKDAETALPAIKRTVPDAVLVDITLPGKSGLELIRQLRSLPRIKILVVSMHDEALYANRVLRAGAHGYVMKQEEPQEIVDALRDVLTGRIYLSEAVLESNSHTPPLLRPKRRLEQLTDDELEILEAIGQGKTKKQIAKTVRLSERRLTTRCAAMRKKLRLKTNEALIRYAVCWVETDQA